MMKRMRNKDLASLMCAMVVIGIMVTTGFSATLYETGFEDSETPGFAVGGWLGYSTPGASPYDGWTHGIPAWDAVSSGTRIGVTSGTYGAPFTGGQFAYQYGAKRGTTKVFNTDSGVGNAQVSVEVYMMMLNTDVSPLTPYSQFGLMTPGTDNSRDVCIRMGENNNNLHVNNGAGLIEADINITFGVWYHFGIAVDYVADTLQLYAKIVSAGDTSDLTSADVVTFGGSDTLAYAGAGNYAGKFYMFLSSDGANMKYDDIRITDENLIPKKGTVIVVQ